MSEITGYKANAPSQEQLSRLKAAIYESASVMREIDARRETHGEQEQHAFDQLNWKLEDFPSVSGLEEMYYQDLVQLALDCAAADGTIDIPELDVINSLFDTNLGSKEAAQLQGENRRAWPGIEASSFSGNFVSWGLIGNFAKLEEYEIDLFVYRNVSIQVAWAVACASGEPSEAQWSLIKGYYISFSFGKQFEDETRWSDAHLKYQISQNEALEVLGIKAETYDDQDLGR